MNKSNLANGLLQGSLDTTSTTVNLQSGYGNIMPAVPFYITVTPFGQLSTMGNSEIMQVTARTGDTLTVVRGQRGTTAKSFINGDVISNGIYTEDIDEKATKLSIPSGTVPYRQGVGNGEPDSSMLISDDATAGTLAQYGSGGTMVVGSPTDDAHAATKKYVDDSLTTLPYEPPLVHKYADVAGPYGIRMQCSRWGDFCTLTTSGKCSGTMPSNGASSEQTPEWCRPWTTQPRCGGAFGGYLGAFWLNYSGNLCWVAGGSITAGNSVTINISWVADHNTRPTN